MRPFLDIVQLGLLEKNMFPIAPVTLDITNDSLVTEAAVDE